MFWPIVTPFGNVSVGSPLLAPMALAKSAYWKMNSFSFEPPSTQLWLTLIELNSFSLVAPVVRPASRGSAPYGCEFWLRP